MSDGKAPSRRLTNNPPKGRLARNRRKGRKLVKASTQPSATKTIRSPMIPTDLDLQNHPEAYQSPFRHL